MYPKVVAHDPDPSQWKEVLSGRKILAASSNAVSKEITIQI
jgi:hypothetical protein